MQTLRGRLTASYSAALALTLAAFAVLLYLDRRSASYQDLDQRIQSEATLTAGILAESYRARGSLVRRGARGARGARGGSGRGAAPPPLRGAPAAGARPAPPRRARAPPAAPGPGGRAHPESPGDRGRRRRARPARRADGEGRAGAA